METTWRARPLDAGRLAFIVLTTLLVVALAGAALVVGSWLRSAPDDQRHAVPVIPTGGEALLAFASYTSDVDSGDVYVVRADGTGGRRLTHDALFDTSPVWSPDGSRIAFNSHGDGVLQLRVADPDGTIRVLADMQGCMDGTNAPAWSPDGRFLVYQVDRDPTDGSCDPTRMDLFVIPADGSGTPHRLLAVAPGADSKTATFSSNPDWVGDRIVMRGLDEGQARLLVATVTDTDQPWDLETTRVDTGTPDMVAFGWSRWSPDGSQIATTYIPFGTGYGTAMVTAARGGSPTSLLRDPTKDQIVPGWSPDGTWLTVLELTEQTGDHGVYHLVRVGVDGSDPRTIETDDLSGNGGPAFISPDGTLAAARAELDDRATPGDILFIDLVGDTPPVSVPARAWSSVSWQPVANPANPAANAPEGLPEL